MVSQQKKVLLIDDDPFIVDIYALKFKQEGFNIEIAQDGKTGMKKIEEFQPDIVLLDIVMPQKDGFDILKDLRENSAFRKVKIILLTNLGQKEDVERGTKLGADDYIIKAHFTPSEVVEKVKALLTK